MAYVAPWLYHTESDDMGGGLQVGGGILADEMEVLVESLTFLHNVGLHPVVIHGAGPQVSCCDVCAKCHQHPACCCWQLNAELAKKGIESDYIGGLRVTTGDILYTARKVCARARVTPTLNHAPLCAVPGRCF